MPDHVRLEEAVVLPLAISTAAVGLFDDLKLRRPSADPVDADQSPEQKHRGETVLIWGAASSMGSVAVQLAVAAGYHVLTTASAKNHGYVRDLARGEHVAVFDYRRAGVADEIIDYVQSREGLTFAGAYDCVGLEDSTRACAAVVRAFGGGVLPSVLPPPGPLPAGVQARCVNAITPGTVPGSPGSLVWRDYVPRALASGTLRARPEPEVVGTGLDEIERALHLHKAGVSAKKLVVLL